MSKEKTRIHIIIPKELVESVNELVGKRSRSRFIAEAVGEKLAHEKLKVVARKVMGSLANVDIPGWETHESTVEWVRALRRQSDEKLQRLWEDSDS